MDNVSAVRYVNHLGGTRSSALVYQASDFWSFCLEKNIMVHAEYLLGLQNGVADWYSRHLTDSTDMKNQPISLPGDPTTLGPIPDALVRVPHQCLTSHLH